MAQSNKYTNHIGQCEVSLTKSWWQSYRLKMLKGQKNGMDKMKIYFQNGNIIRIKQTKYYRAEKYSN